MADSTLSITVRDPLHPCAPYRTTAHSFKAQIFHCDGTPLFWKGVNYGSGAWLTDAGAAGGRIHGQFKVPEGCYLVRAVATCKNVIGDWVWVNVGCNETVCVSIVFPTVKDCINRTLAGLLLGTVDPPQEEEKTVKNIMPNEVSQAVQILGRIAERLPREVGLPEPPTVEEIQRDMRDAPR
jgi:hypothetical protein